MKVNYISMVTKRPWQSKYSTFNNPLHKMYTKIFVKLTILLKEDDLSPIPPSPPPPSPQTLLFTKVSYFGLKYILVNGGFSSWIPFTKCSVTCGTGHQVRYRECTHPKPDYGGDECVGEREKSSQCNVNVCTDCK